LGFFKGEAMANKTHWESVYSSKGSDSVSWFQLRAELSLELIQSTGLGNEAAIIDVGAGASTLVDDLLNAGHICLSVLDLSGAALAESRRRLGDRSDQVTWIEGDVNAANFAPASIDLWHDRAVFHFLTVTQDRDAYLSQLQTALKPGGHLIMATFASDGPERCSNLPVVRYEPEQLQTLLGDGFTLKSVVREAHQTPGGNVQHFVYVHFMRN
jgi:ubiquinone/menaquinone biosynthesis C-methylase UbiE